jgi:putative hemolysin
MTTDIVSSLTVIMLLTLARMLLSAGFSALVSARKGVLKERAESGQRAAKRALALGEDSTQLLATQQFVLTLLNLVIVAIIALHFWVDIENSLEKSGLSSAVAQTTIYVVWLPMLAGGFMIVDRLAAGLVGGRAETVAILTASLMNSIIRALSPFVLAILRISGRTAVLMGGSEITHFVTEEEIKTIVDAGSEEGVIEDEEKEMIYSVMRFGDTLAREVMVPRIDIIALNIDATLSEALNVIINGGHSRIPVYRDTIDNIEGILYAKDMLKVWRDGEQLTSLQPLLRQPYFVPESKNASELLIELQDIKTHLVIVVDEYGGTAGILTIEDLIEEIVGEIQDEYDIDEEAQYEKISENEYIFNARIDLDDLNELLDVSIPTHESDTLGGYVYTELGRVPVVNDTFTYQNLEFRVLSVTGRRIRKVYVRKLVQVSPEDVKDPATLSEDGTSVAHSPSVSANTLPNVASVNS